MTETIIFKKELECYYQYMIDRFEKGYKYLEANPDDKKAQELYNNIIQEIKIIESLRAFYKGL